MEAKTETKSYTIWLLKIFATFMVIYIHAANIYGYSNLQMPTCFRPFSLLANTGVPLFMLISGFLFFRKEVEWKENTLKKIKRLAIPFLIWSGFWVVIEVLGFLFFPAKFDNVFSDGIIGVLKLWIGIPFIQGPLYGPLWYVRELFIISIVAPLIQKPLRKWPKVFSIVGIVLWLLPINTMFRRTVVLFILGGALSNEKKIIEKLKRFNWKTGVIILLIGVAISFFQNSITYQITLALYSVSALIIGTELVKGKSAQRFSFEISKYIFLIYCIHGKPLSILQIIYTSLFKSPALVYVGYFLLPIICFGICLGIAYVFKRFLPSAYKICTGE